jgi:hypothetical protein
MLAALEKGGVFTSPCNHMSGLSVFVVHYQDMSFLTYSQVPDSQADANERLTRQTTTLEGILQPNSMVQYFCSLK